MSSDEDVVEAEQPTELIILNDLFARILEEVLSLLGIYVHPHSPTRYDVLEMSAVDVTDALLVRHRDIRRREQEL